MNQQIECDIILDLLPLSIEGMVSQETNALIAQHIKVCDRCRQIYEEMNCEIDFSLKRRPMKIHRLKRKNRMKTFILLYLFFLLSIIVWIIVDVTFF